MRHDPEHEESLPVAVAFAAHLRRRAELRPGHPAQHEIAERLRLIAKGARVPAEAVWRA
ncbi:MAG TPA: hypothetical protein VHX61_02640 [Rhizomicrobium sp.]|jgi:hypothetical protein|nr:hypothetical protein [Rhizomicrobium sp.]